MKDVVELKSCILKSVIEKKLGQAKLLFDLMHERFWRMDSENRDSLIVRKINNPEKVGEVRKGHARRVRGGHVPSSSQKATFKIGLKNEGLYVDFPTALKKCKNPAQLRDWFRKEKDRLMKLKYDHIFNGDENGELLQINWHEVSSGLVGY